MIILFHLEIDTTDSQPTPLIKIMVVHQSGGHIHQNALEMGRRYLVAMGIVIQYLGLHPFKEILNLLLLREHIDTQTPLIHI
jgi:hypothetical protein